MVFGIRECSLRYGTSVGGLLESYTKDKYFLHNGLGQWGLIS